MCSLPTAGVAAIRVAVVETEEDPKRLLTSLGLAGGIGAAWLAYEAGWRTPRRLAITTCDIALPSWRVAEPLRLLVMSDFHACGPHMTARRLAAVVARAQTLAPDLVLLLGDFVATHALRTGRLAPEAIADLLDPLRAPLGVAAVLGNHDWKEDPRRVRRALEAVDVRVLENEALRLRHHDQDFWLAGLEDGRFGLPDLARTLAPLDGDLPVILMSHSPDVFVDLPAHVGLTVSGHTHGGQIRLPWLGPLLTCSAHGRRFAKGHVIEGGRQLFVSSGLGCSVLPARLGVVPEIALLTLSGA